MAVLVLVFPLPLLFLFSPFLPVFFADLFERRNLMKVEGAVEVGQLQLFHGLHFLHMNPKLGIVLFDRLARKLLRKTRLFHGVRELVPKETARMNVFPIGLGVFLGLFRGSLDLVAPRTIRLGNRFELLALGLVRYGVYMR